MPFDISETHYTAGGTAFEARFMEPAPPAAAAPGPPVLLLPEFTGPGPYLTRHAERLAERGSPVLMPDLYPADENPDCHGFGLKEGTGHRDECLALARALRVNRGELRLRVRAALDELLSLTGADEGRAYVLGFSFGGMAALELARMGAAPAGVISVYGRLDAAPHMAARKVLARVLVIQGLLDKVAPLKDLAGFSAEMQKAGARPRVSILAYAGHGFMNRFAEPRPQEGAFYSARAEARAWAGIDRFMRRQ